MGFKIRYRHQDLNDPLISKTNTLSTLYSLINWTPPLLQIKFTFNARYFWSTEELSQLLRKNYTNLGGYHLRLIKTSLNNSYNFSDLLVIQVFLSFPFHVYVSFTYNFCPLFLQLMRLLSQVNVYKPYFCDLRCVAHRNEAGSDARVCKLCAVQPTCDAHSQFPLD